MMKKFACAVFALVSLAYAQSDRGVITGTVVDSTGAAVPRAKVTGTNVATGSVVSTQTTNTGVFTLPSLPVGLWNVTVEADGFKKYVSKNTEVQVAQTVNLAISLEVGSASESITVEANAVELQTETAENSITVNNQVLMELPIAWSNGWFGNEAVRNPLSVEQIMPGVSGGSSFFGYQGLTSGGSALDGQPPSTFKILLEGQDDTSSYAPSAAFYSQPSVEALQEVTLQANNFSAEFGQAQGGIYNFTTKSGTNEWHGGAFYRLTNEDLNAHQPSFYGAQGALPESRQNNYGGTFGGPIIIPHLYNGRNKTFFFFSFEGFHSAIPVPGSGTFITVPNANDRAGNFSGDLGPQVKCNGGPCVDALGSPVLAGEIFDPKSLAADGYTRFPFPNNTIPLNRMDPVALKIQSFLPSPTNSLAALNYQLTGVSPRPETIPSIKLDQNFSDTFKLSIFDSGVTQSSIVTPDGLPPLLTQGRVDPGWANTTRVSVDDTLRPTMLLHLGVGYAYVIQYERVPSQDTTFKQVSELGLTGALSTGFPAISGLSDTGSTGASIGGQSGTVGSRFKDVFETGELTSAASLSWTTGSHSYKFGGSGQKSMLAQTRCDALWGQYAFSAGQTGQPFGAGGAALSFTGGSPGLSYASFLLGSPSQVTIGPCDSVNWHYPALGIYAQDTWKVFRKLTLDYGLRYDLEGPPREDRNRVSTFNPTVANPSAGGLLGGIIYQGFGPDACNCSNFMKTYKYAFGPRLGVAYQLNQKTVLRAAWGIFYGGADTSVSGPNQVSPGTGYDLVTFLPPTTGASALPNGLEGGLSFSQSLFDSTLHSPGALPTTNPITGISNVNTSVANGTLFYAAQEGRPPRIEQYNVTLQRQLTPGMTIEAAYVGNRGVWLLGALSPQNDVTPAILAAHGLSLSNPANLTLLTQTISSASVKAAGFVLPFANFPATTTLANTLRPFPQYDSSSLAFTTTDGDSWYNSLQVKLTARLKHNITVLSTYTWAKSLVRNTTFDNWLDPANLRTLDPNSIPQALQINGIYQTPHLSSANFLGGNRLTRAVFSDWQISTVLRYQSGGLITAPLSNDLLSTYLAGAPTQYMTRVPGAPLYLVNPNSRFDPTKQLVLNPAAWTECGPTATFGCGAPYYSDFRQRRTPMETISLGRRFQLSEKGNRFFEIRMEMYNAFNQIVYPNVTVGNPTVAPTLSAASLLTGGFGFINANNIATGTARNMLITARLAF